MADYPIIFSEQMVRALLDDRKTMMRRLAWSKQEDHVAISYRVDGLDIKGHESFSARDAFCALWRNLHGADAWDANPECVCLTFSVIRANLDSEDALAA